jgi:O-antigen/teichoic acid export membrane protein
MSFRNDTAWNAVGVAFSMAGRLLCTSIIARSFAPAQFGELVFLQWLIEIVFVICSLGLTGAGTRFFAVYLNSTGEASEAFRTWYSKRSIFAVSACTIVTPIFAVLLTSTRTTNELLAICSWALFSGIWATMVARLQGVRRFGRVAAANAVFAVVALAGFTLEVGTASPLSAMIVYSVASLAAVLFCAFVHSAPNENTISNDIEFSRTEVRSYAHNVWITSLVSAMIWSRGELLFVQTLLTPEEVGFYSAALYLTGLVGAALALLTGALGPTLAHYWGKREYDAAAMLSRRVTDVLLLASGATVGILVTFPSEILTIFFGTKYTGSRDAVVLLAFGCFGLASGATNIILQYKSNGAFARNLNLGSVPLWFGILLVAITSMGYLGAAIGRTIAQLSIAGVVFLFAALSCAVPPFRLRNLFATLTLTVLLALIAHTVGDSHLLWRICGYSAYVGSLAFILLDREQFMKFIKVKHPTVRGSDDQN